MFMFVAAALDSLPVPVRELAITVCAWVQVAVSIKQRRNVEKNLSGIGVEASRRTVLGIFRNHTRNIVEMFTVSRRTVEEIQRGMTARGLDVLDAELAAGRGVILVTAHVGNWEFGALYLGSLGYRLHAVTGVQMNRLLTGALRDIKERNGIMVVNPKHSYRKLFRALEKNGVVALLVDGDIFLEGAVMNFFDKRIPLPTGAVRLARRTGASIVGVCCWNLGREDHLIHIERIVAGDEIAELTDAQALGRVYATAERFIRSNYEQWCIFRDFWGECH